MTNYHIPKWKKKKKGLKATKNGLTGIEVDQQREQFKKCFAKIFLSGKTIDRINDKEKACGANNSRTSINGDTSKKRLLNLIYDEGLFDTFPNKYRIFQHYLVFKDN